MDREASTSTMSGTTQRQAERAEAERRIAEGDEPWREQSGVQSVVAAVRDVRFPTDATSLVREAGDRVVVVSGTMQRPLREILSRLSEDRFEDVGEFQTAVMRHWEGIRYLEVPQEQRPPQGGGRPRQAPKRPRSTKDQRKANRRRGATTKKPTTRKAKKTRGARRTTTRKTSRPSQKRGSAGSRRKR